MKLRFFVLNLVLTGFFALIPPSGHAAAERVALVIGNGAYQTAPLRNPVNDAEDMAAALRSAGFEVILKVNADKRAMVLAMDEFEGRLRTAEVGLFYFAGHGIQIKGLNYLVPVGVHVASEADVEFETVDAGRLLRKMEVAGNKVNIVIMDACRNNPFGRSFRSETRGLARMDAPTGSIVVFSTAPGSVAADGSGRNGIYTKHLLNHMKAPGLKIEEVLKKVRNAVLEETGRQQTPWESSSLTGDFFFVSAIAAPAPGVVPNYDDLVRQRRESAQQWAVWQGRMDAEFDKAQKYDRMAELKPQEKAGLWQTFLSGFAQDNRNSAKDEELRLKAQERLGYWQKQVQTAAITPSATDATRTLTGLLKYANGVIFDPTTNLEWYAGPDRDTNWGAADQWVRSLSVGGGGWRLPTQDELRGLYKKGVGSRNMDPAFETTGWWIWSVARDSSSAWVFVFNDGTGYWTTRNNDSNDRAFAVRSRR